MRRNGFRGSGNKTKIRLVIFIKRSGNADDDRVHGFKLFVVGGRRQSLLACALDFRLGDSKDVGATAVQSGNLAFVYVEAGDGKTALAVEESQGKADVSQSDDCNARLALLNLALQFRKVRGRKRLAAHN